MSDPWSVGTGFANTITHGAGHKHCWHLWEGPIWMVAPNGHIPQKCCVCEAMRTVHHDHAREHKP